MKLLDSKKKPTAFTFEANKMSKIIKNKNKVLKIHKQSINQKASLRY